jgi:hypothetical protein
MTANVATLKMPKRVHSRIWVRWRRSRRESKRCWRWRGGRRTNKRTIYCCSSTR